MHWRKNIQIICCQIQVTVAFECGQLHSKVVDSCQVKQKYVATLTTNSNRRKV